MSTAEDALRFQAQLLDQVDAAVIATDVDGHITHWNNHAETLFDRRKDEVLGEDGASLVLAPAERSTISQIRARLKAGERIHDEFLLMRKDGTCFSALMRAAPVTDAEGGCMGFVGVAVDMTERKRARQELEQRTAQQAMIASLGQRALEGIGLSRLMDEAAFVIAETLDVELTGMFEYIPGEDALLLHSGSGWREGAVRTARVPADERYVTGATLIRDEAVLIADLKRDGRFTPSWLLREHGVRSGAVVQVAGRESRFGVLGAFSTRPGALGADCLSFLKAVANVLAEASERRRAEAETRHRALHDPLTNLPNRTLFLDRLEHGLNVVKRSESSLAVFFLDLDQFKAINDTLGHQAGDELLLALAPRLQSALRPSDTVARFGGDEFVVLSEELPDRDAARLVAERISSVFERPFAIAGHDHYVTASIGIAMPGDRDVAPEDLIRDADAAMYRAKERGRARFEFFDERMRPHALLKLRTEHDLRGAAERGELRLHYQPVVDIETGRVAALEALARWEHPERGLLQPADFIPLAEQSGLILDIGRWVLREAGRQAAAWRSSYNGGAPLPITVNVSARQVTGSDLADTVEIVLRDNDLPGSALALELTESALIEEAESPVDMARSLKALGVRLALDDFGTGYSSLSYLQRFPIDVLKIDRAFVAGLDRASTASIVTAVVTMAEALGLDVVAEGIESESQLYGVRALGCRYAQGFLLARPMPPAAIEQMLVRGAPAAVETTS